jgi:hypothetical protein
MSKKNVIRLIIGLVVVGGLFAVDKIFNLGVTYWVTDNIMSLINAAF